MGIAGPADKDGNSPILELSFHCLEGYPDQQIHGETTMPETKYDVLAIGNAIVDIIARCEDDFLVSENIVKGAMNLIDMDRAEALYAAMGPAVETSGGSAGNTAAGIASFSGSAAYIGKSLMTIWERCSVMISRQLGFSLIPRRSTTAIKPPAR